MTSAQSVFDFVKSLPKFMAHEDMYLDKLREAHMLKEKVPIDMLDYEAATIGWLEQNILSTLKYDYKFVQQDFCLSHKVRFDVLAKQNDVKNSLSNIKHDSELELKYTATHKKKLAPNESALCYPSGDSASPTLDAALVGMIRAACSNVNGMASNDMAMTGYTERVMVPTDMRHMLLKAYLYLQDFSLAVTSGYTKAKIGVVRSRQVIINESSQKLLALLNYKVIVDAENFEDDEIKLLNLISDAYPKIKYAGDNVYNSIMLKADNVAILTDKDYTMPFDLNFKSPTDMCVLLYNLAMKLGVLGQLREVIKGFRGAPCLMEDICEETGSEHFTLEFNRSVCYRGMLERLNDWKEDIRETSSYYGTSVCLVADALVTEGLKYNVLSLLEDLAALGPAGLPTGIPATDPIFQCLLRDHGLKHEADSINTLKGTWTVNRNSSLLFGTSGILKEYVTSKLTKLMENKMDGAGMFFGPIGYLIPASNQLKSSWATLGGWRPIDIIPVNDNIKVSQHRAAFAHMMGMTTMVPIIGENALGTLFARPMVKYDYKLERLTGGTYTIAKMTISPIEELEGRIDDLELTIGSLIELKYQGTIGRIILTDQKTIELVENVNEIEVKETFGAKSDNAKKEDDDTDGENEYVEPITPGGGKISKRHGIEKVVKKSPFVVVNKAPMLTKKPDDKNIIVTSEPKTGELSIAVDKTKGDGTCGIHAVVQDLISHNIIDAKSYDRVREELIATSAEKSWQSVDDLALLVNTWGMGLSALVRTDKGWKCLNYGTNNKAHNVRIKLDGGHYENWKEDPNSKIKLKIVESEKGKKPEETYEKLEMNKKWFKMV